MKAADARKRLLQNPELRAEYETKKLAREIARSVIIARAQAELSQTQLAELLNTKQPSIARIENGEHLPSLSFLMRIAQALDAELTPPLLIGPKPIIKAGALDSQTQLLQMNFIHKVRKAFTVKFTSESQAHNIFAGGSND